MGMQLSKQVDWNRSVSTPQIDLFKRLTGHDIPPVITTFGGASKAIAAASQAFDQGKRAPMDDLTIPSDASATSWDNAARTSLGNSVPADWKLISTPAPVSTPGAVKVKVSGGKGGNATKAKAPAGKPAAPAVPPPPATWSFNAQPLGFKADPTLVSRVRDPKSPKIAGHLVRTCDQEVEYYLMHGDNVMLLGHGGTGKDSCLDWQSAKHGWPLVVGTFKNSSVLDDYYGTDYVEADGKGGTTSGFREGELLQVAVHGGIYCASEVNGAMANELIGLQYAIEARELPVTRARKTYKMSDQFHFVVNGNPCGEGYAGVNGMNKAFRDRFAIVRFPAFTKDELAKLIGTSKHFEKCADLYSRCQYAMETGTPPLKGLISLRGLCRLARDLENGMPPNLAVHTNVLMHFREEGREQAYRAALSFARHNWPTVQEDMGKDITIK